MQIGNFDNPKIVKKILSTGRGFKPFEIGAKVKFHFLTRKCGDSTVIDDSRKLGKPMELVIGKKFKLECWETMVQAMAIGEIASFTVDKSLLYSYPLVSKTLRDANEPGKPRSRHCCGQMAYALEYDDLNALMREPVNLEFIIEMLSVESPGEYEVDTWQLTREDRLMEIPKLKDEGNALYNEGKYRDAADKYSKALGFLDQLMLVEKPGDIEWKQLNDQKIPLLLNYSQCKLLLKDYYEVIEHCTTVLQHDPNNVKAVFRRGKAHMAVWNREEAKKDLEKAAQLSPSLSSTVKQLLVQLSQLNKETDSTLKSKLEGKLF